MSLTARYPGRCPACDEPINVGDPICAVENDDDTVYVHADRNCTLADLDTDTPSEPQCEQHYRNAPEIVAELAAELERWKSACERAEAVIRGINTGDSRAILSALKIRRGDQ